MDPLIKSQLLYQLSYAPEKALRIGGRAPPRKGGEPIIVFPQGGGRHGQAGADETGPAKALLLPVPAFRLEQVGIGTAELGAP